MGWLFRGIKEFLAARGPCCVAAEANTRHTQLCHRSGAQVTQNQLLVHTLSRTFKKTFIHTTKWKATPPFHANENLSMGTVIEAGGLQDGTASEYRNKAIPLDVTYADPQAGVHMRTGSSDRDRSAPSTSEAGKHSHYTSPGQGSFDERRCKFATLAVKSCWCLGKEGRNLIGQVTAGNLGDQHHLDVRERRTRNLGAQHHLGLRRRRTSISPLRKFGGCTRGGAVRTFLRLLVAPIASGVAAVSFSFDAAVHRAGVLPV